jgi:CheY-like chemotaxis protein
MVAMGAPRARAVPDPVTKSGSAAAVLDFAVGQILRDDTALGALDLPGMTGIELLAALREVAPALPVAVTSAHALDGTLTSLLGHADEYLEKPVRVDTLIATATALIGPGRRPASGSAGLQGTDRAG